MSLKHGILGLLSLEDASGYDLSKLFQESLNYFWVANQSQIYRELDGMEEKHWVTARKVLQDNRPNRKVYSITQEGINELINWLKDGNISQLMVIRCPLLMKIFFASKVDKQTIIRLLLDYKTECQSTYRNIKTQAVEVSKIPTQGPPYWKYTMDYCLGYYEFLIKWAEQTIEDLQRG